jgi:Lrp/AsnC family transcriptional regulator for asnA, asnC and gidA
MHVLYPSLSFMVNKMTGSKIDEINANIIRKLIANARTSFTKMAKDSNITVVALRNRYETLKKTGIITGEIMQINPYILGFNCNGHLRFNVNQEKIKETIEFLKNEPYIFSIWHRKHEFNIGAFFGTPNLEYFDKIKNRLRTYPYIKDFKHLIYVNYLINDHPEKLIIKNDIDIEQQKDLEKKPHRVLLHKPFIETKELKQIPPIDRIIAKMLSENARISFSTIAKKLNVSTSHVIKRYNTLKKKNFFLRSTITLNLQKLGYKGVAMIHFNVEMRTDFSEIQKKILNIPNLIVLVKTIGETDMFAIVPIASFEEFFKLKGILQTTKGIEAIKIDLTPTDLEWPHNYFAQLL